MPKLLPHPLSEIFPNIPAEELKELADDIKQHGLHTDIVLYEGQILDGRHRYLACRIAKVEPRAVEYKGKDPLGFVLSHNLKRRHLSDSQRGMIASRLANMPRGNPDFSKCLNSGISQEKAAKTLAVSRDTVQRATKIAKKSPELAKQIDDGKLSINAATKQLAAANTAKWAAAKKPEVEAEEVFRDAMGYIIPKHLVPFWLRGREVQELMTHISKVRVHLKDAMSKDDMLYHSLGGGDGQFLVRLDGIYHRIADCKPYAVCPNCSGTEATKNSCMACHATGWLSKYAYDKFPNKGLMKLREVQIKQQQQVSL